MRFPFHLIPHGTKIDFVGKRWWGFVASGLLTIASVVSLYTHGLNLGIDFTGGVLMEARTETAADLGTLRHTLDGGGFGEITLQALGSDRDVLIRIQMVDGANQNAVVEKVKNLLGAGVEYRKIDFVGPALGKELVQSALLAVGLSFLAIMAYVWFRFEWQFGLGTIAALAHDAAMMIGFYAITGYDFGAPAIAAILTIIGYSVNDSVVIYDRIRENMRKYRKMTMHDLINLSMNETLSRAVMTHLTTLLAALALVFFGGEVLRGFSLSLAFGVVVGAYSSIIISAPMLMYLKVRPDALMSAEPAKA